MPEPIEVPYVRDLRPKIRALLPQNMQTRVLAAVAVLMTLIILFSGRKSAAPPARPKPPAAVQPTDPNQTRIQEYRAGIDAATQQLAAEEAQLTRAKQALAQASPAAALPNSASPTPPATVSRAPAFDAGHESPAVREDQSLFASNIALSYRSARERVAPEPERRETNRPESMPAPKPAPEGDETTFRVLEGTVIETVLTNRLDSTFSGPVNCLVTTDVYSPDRSVLLIPQGSRLLGEVRKLGSLGEQRLAVTFHRLLRPDGYSMSLDHFEGLGQSGETGLRDQVNHHYFQVFGASLAIGAIAGLAQANTRYGLQESASDAYAQGVATSLSQSSLHVLDRYLNVLPTFTIREGHRIKVYLAQDIMLPAYPAKTEE